jgi:hypothetical protein
LKREIKILIKKKTSVFINAFAKVVDAVQDVVQAGMAGLLVVQYV